MAEDILVCSEIILVVISDDISNEKKAIAVFSFYVLFCSKIRYICANAVTVKSSDTTSLIYVDTQFLSNSVNPVETPTIPSSFS